MLCHLPTPYPDELLYSVIARYLIRIGAASVRNVTDSLFGHKTKACVDLPSSLDSVSERTWLIWGMTSKEVADRLTMFPYYARYVPRERVARCLRALQSPNGTGVHARLGVGASRVKLSPFLRFCKACRERDLLEYGETYWHRSHQLAGVLVCPEHGEPLIDSNALLRPREFSGFADATQCTAAIARVADNDLNGIDVINAFKIANRCREILAGPIPAWPQERKPYAYQREALKRGFYRNFFTMELARFEKAFVAFHGEPLLSKLGCGIELRRDSWVRAFFRTREKAFHPLQHVLVQIFLESVPLEESTKLPRHPYEPGPWKCPNPYAGHGDSLPIKQALKIRRIRPSGEIVFTVKCCCGYHFTFSRTSDYDRYQPIVRRVLEFGPAWEAEAERLRQSGLRRYAIAKAMHRDFKTVEKLLKKSRRIRCCPAKTQIEDWRQQWSMILSKTRNRSCVLARRKNAALYARLWRWDREWLRAQSQPRNIRSAAKPRIDWIKRDEKWSQILRTTAQEIIKASELARRRIAPTTIIKASGLSSIASRRYLNRLPACRAVLNEYSDQSLDDSRERRLRSAVKEARETGLPPKEWAFRLLSGLSGKELSPRLNAVLQELVSDARNIETTLL